jgi:uncharacterized protein with NAD-binding domain and iron-sulfur cluster
MRTARDQKEAPSRVAVVGAGISGLTCAYELQKGGADVVVYESSDHVGGRMSTRVKDGLYFDIGADHLCDHYVHMKSLCAELDIEWEQMRHVEYAVIRDHEAVPLHQAVGWWSKMKLAMQYSPVDRGSAAERTAGGSADSRSGVDQRGDAVRVDSVRGDSVRLDWAAHLFFASSIKASSVGGSTGCADESPVSFT